MKRSPSSVHGVLVVDKPRGPTSHDVVRWARRAFGTRSVGHAGTLDPMATGVLVLAVGEATKLVPYLTAAQKSYDATVRLGVETDTLDAEGRVTREAPLDPWPDAARVAEAAGGFLGPRRQRVPDVSAVRVGGERLHARVRRGEKVQAPERTVEVHAIEVTAVRGPQVDLTVSAGKGFYVRALARDLAAALGTVGHLTALRRTRSGDFGLGPGEDTGDLLRAAAGEVGGIGVDTVRHALRQRLLSPRGAWGARPVARLSEEGAADAHHGRPISPARVLETDAAPGDVVGLVGPGEDLLAIGRLEADGALQVVRGLRMPPAAERDRR